MNEWKCGSSVSCSKWECGGRVGGDPDRKLPQLLSCQLPWPLVLVCDWHLQAPPNLGLSSDDWFSELDYNQSDINCQFLQQLKTSPHHLHRSQQTEPSDQKVQGGHFEPDSNSWMQSGVVARCSDRSTKVPFSRGFHSKHPLEKGCTPAVHSELWGNSGPGRGRWGFCCLARVVVVVRLNGRFVCWP